MGSKDVLTVVLLLEQQGVESSDLDEMVYEMCVACSMEELNEAEEEEEQEEVLASAEDRASEINNGGLRSQVEYLRGVVSSRAELIKMLENTVPGVFLPVLTSDP